MGSLVHQNARDVLSRLLPEDAPIDVIMREYGEALQCHTKIEQYEADFLTKYLFGIKKRMYDIIQQILNNQDNKNMFKVHLLTCYSADRDDIIERSCDSAPSIKDLLIDQPRSWRNWD